MALTMIGPEGDYHNMSPVQACTGGWGVGVAQHAIQLTNPHMWSIMLWCPACPGITMYKCRHVEAQMPRGADFPSRKIG